MIAPQERPAARFGDDLPENYYHLAEHCFSRAAAAGTRELFIELAGLKICLRTAGDTLLPRLAATLAHLEISNQAPVAFTICCWDGQATGADLPLPSPSLLAPAKYCCLGLLTNERIRTFYIEWLREVICMDLEANIAYCCYSSAERLLMYEISGPLRPVFSTILNRQGMHLIHAAAVGTPRGSLVFAGPPGAGKSTLAILCLQEGLAYQSDDLCVLTSEPRPRSLSIYNMAKLREDALPRFPSLHPILSHFEETERKAFFYVHQHFPRQVLKAAPVRALLLPRIDRHLSASHLEPARPLEAAHAVISWTNREFPRSNNAGDHIMMRAVSRIPAYRLHLGQDDRQTLALITSLLDDT